MKIYISHIYIICTLIFFITSCKSENKKNDLELNDSELTKENQLENKNETNIEVLFENEKFTENIELELLKELGIGMCDPNQKDLANYTRPACDPKFFKFFQLSKNKPLKNEFILLVKSMVHDFPLRRVFVFQRMDNKLVKVNGFIANLIGKRKSKTNYDDLILRFSDKDKNHFNCLYVWKNNHYEYEKVEEINDSKIKAVFQDSMNFEINKMIELNRMQF
jgi:hypothetical protein